MGHPLRAPSLPTYLRGFLALDRCEVGVPLFDSCVVWRMLGPAGGAIICYAIHGSEGLALTVEHEGEMVLAEMMPSLERAMHRAEAVRRMFVRTGLLPIQGD